MQHFETCFVRTSPYPRKKIESYKVLLKPEDGAFAYNLEHTVLKHIKLNCIDTGLCI